MPDFRFPVPRWGESHRPARAHFALRRIRALVGTYVAVDGCRGFTAALRCALRRP
jgi:hypothetical protein